MCCLVCIFGCFVAWIFGSARAVLFLGINNFNLLKIK